MSKSVSIISGHPLGVTGALAGVGHSGLFAGRLVMYVPMWSAGQCGGHLLAIILSLANAVASMPVSVLGMMWSLGWSAVSDHSAGGGLCHSYRPDDGSLSGPISAPLGG